MWKPNLWETFGLLAFAVLMIQIWRVNEKIQVPPKPGLHYPILVGKQFVVLRNLNCRSTQKGAREIPVSHPTERQLPSGYVVTAIEQQRDVVGLGQSYADAPCFVPYQALLANGSMVVP